MTWSAMGSSFCPTGWRAIFLQASMEKDTLTQQELTPQQRFEALRMAIVAGKIESLSDDDGADSGELENAYGERSTLLRRYFSATFGSNVVPLISQPS